MQFQRYADKSISCVTHVLIRNFDSTKVRFYSQDGGDADVPQLKEAPEIEIKDVEKLVKNPPRIIILDVRRPEELREEGNVPTAFNLPVDDLEDALKLNKKFFRVLFGFDKPDPDDLIVVYCRSGKSRSIPDCAIFEDSHECGWCGSYGNMHVYMYCGVSVVSISTRVVWCCMDASSSRVDLASFVVQ
ncbi:hypothetical protein HELRODRAFT_163115 [Helobdella robusta]|uniref:Rhodanese domain-containing protein n=1 Tax=Helobdella robusta TaxID=6412 RepID=T1ETP0_HELRO|nr:hypothetical protein HELRODRAFT_163115 [Helobdella robusta]ESN96085.1 hypothetical protein HELRODRAFT_163115 [Helobdella robusta]